MLTTLIEALAALCPETHHFYAPPNTMPPYLVWAEDGGNDLGANNQHVERAVTGSLNLFTRDEADPLIRGVRSLMDRLPVAYSLISVSWEEETGLIHYSWDWEV